MGPLVLAFLVAMLVVPSTVAAVWEVAGGHLWEGAFLGGVTFACLVWVMVWGLRQRA